METGGRVEEGEPIGPSAADEAAMLGEDDLPSVAIPVVPRAAPTRLPSLDSLVAKISPETRQALDEHLRARFMRVRKLNPGELR